MRKVLPVLKTEYFSDKTERIIYEEINKFTETYNSTPTIEAIGTDVKEGEISRMKTLESPVVST
jgi:hypothetical protein